MESTKVKLSKEERIKNNIITFKIRLGNVEIKKIKSIRFKNTFRINIVKQFLIDISKKYPDLIFDLHLCMNDYLGGNNTTIIDMRNEKIDNPNDHTFSWGISKMDKNIISIVDSSRDNFNKQIFVFTKKYNSNHILFPSLQLLSNGSIYNNDNDENYTWTKKFNLKDNLNFEEKKNKLPLMRNTNIVFDINNLSRIKLLEYSYLNKDKIDFKLGNKINHVKFNEHLISKQFLKLYQYKNIIRDDIDLDDFYNWFKCDNYISFTDIIKNNRYFIIGYGGQYLPYYLSSSIIFKSNKEEYLIYEDLIFNEEEIKIIDLEDIDEHINIYEKNCNLATKNIKSRHNKYIDYLSYDNLIKHFGKFLLDYSNKKNYS